MAMLPFSINVTRIPLLPYLSKMHFPSWKFKQAQTQTWQRTVSLSPHRSLCKAELWGGSRPKVNEKLITRESCGCCRCSVLVWKRRRLSQDVCSTDTVNHMTDGSRADYGVLTFGIARNIFDKLASSYIWFNPQYKSHENSKLKIIKWAGNNQIPHISPPPQMTDFDMLKFHKGSTNIP